MKHSRKAEELEKGRVNKKKLGQHYKRFRISRFAENIRKKQDEYEKHFAPSLFTENSIINENQENPKY